MKIYLQYVTIFFKKYYDNQTWYKIGAVIIFLIGFTLYLLGIIGVLKKVFIDEFALFLTDFGKTITAGGVISFFLKFMKFMRMMSDEMIAIIYETRYLENRKDLSQIWDRVTQILVENRFPKINSLIREDIKNNYLLSNNNHYFENTSEVYKIRIIDEENNIIQVVQHLTLNMIPSPSNKPYEFSISNDLKIGESYEPTCILNYIKINGEERNDLKLEPNIITTNGEKKLHSRLQFALYEKTEIYQIEYEMTRTLSLVKNDIIAVKVGHIHHNYKVRFDFSGLKMIDFGEAGTIGEFKTNYESEYYLEKEYAGLLYKNQGYLVYLKR